MNTNYDQEAYLAANNLPALADAMHFGPAPESVTVIHPDADFDARQYHMAGHAEGLAANDMITLASALRILVHAAGCCDDNCRRCYPDHDTF